MRKNLPQSEDIASEELPPVVRPTRLRQLTFNGGIVDRLDFLAEEVPVALVYNGVSHAVMMASPADLEDFAIGFSLTEGIIARAEEIGLKNYGNTSFPVAFWDIFGVDGHPVRATVQEMGSEGVSQEVGMNVFGDAGLQRILLHHRLY